MVRHSSALITDGWRMIQPWLSSKYRKVLKPNWTSNHLHPAILDCTFQLIIQLLKAVMDINQGFVFVPTRIGRIVFRKSHGDQLLLSATLLRRAPHSLTAEFTIFDSEGIAIAVIKDARFRSIRLGKAAEIICVFSIATASPNPMPSIRIHTTHPITNVLSSFVNWLSVQQ